MVGLELDRAVERRDRVPAAVHERAEDGPAVPRRPVAGAFARERRSERRRAGVRLGRGALPVRVGVVAREPHGQGIALAGDGQIASNQLRLELVRDTAGGNLPLSQNVAQAIAMNR